MNFLRAALTVPIFAGGLMVAKQSNPTAPFKSADLSMLNIGQIEKVKSAPVTDISPVAERRVASEESVTYRRLRIERVLMTLDSVAAVAMQMQPEQASRIEPVLVDLAERTLLLVEDDAIKKTSTDAELDEIEETLTGLMSSINKTIEPEARL